MQFFACGYLVRLHFTCTHTTLDLLTTPPGFPEGMDFSHHVEADSDEVVPPHLPTQTVNISEILGGGSVPLEWGWGEEEGEGEGVGEQQQVCH